MGVYDTVGNNQIQIKISPKMRYYRIGDKFPHKDGLYLTPEGWFVVLGSIVLLEGTKIFNKYGDKIKDEVKQLLDTFNPVAKVVEEVEAKYFGKDCEHLAVQWESSEEMGGQYWVDQFPVLNFCNHSQNPEDTEGNCRKEICPLGCV